MDIANVLTERCQLQAQQREEERVSDIVHRAIEKDEKLATLRNHRDHVNACKSLEKKLDLDLKREKVKPVIIICGTQSVLVSVNPLTSSSVAALQHTSVEGMDPELQHDKGQTIFLATSTHRVFLTTLDGIHLCVKGFMQHSSSPPLNIHCTSTFALIAGGQRAGQGQAWCA